MKGDKFVDQNNIDIEQLIKDFSNVNEKNSKPTKIDKRYDKYSKKFKERFNREPYIAEPSGTKEQTIEAIKVCLKKNKDILDELLYPNSDKFIY